MVPTTPPRPSWYLRPEAWVFLGAWLLRLLVLRRFAETSYFLVQLGDMKFYDAWAQRVVQGHFSDGSAFYGLPGYAFLLAGFYKVMGLEGGGHIFAVALAQAALEGGTAVLIFKCAKLGFQNEKNALPAPAAIGLAVLAATAWAVYLPAQALAVILMPTAWLVCTYWYCVYEAARPGARSAWHPWPWLGLLIGLMAMTVATILFVVPLLLARIALSVGQPLAKVRRARQAAMAMGLLLGGVALGTASAWAHNYFYAQDPVFLSAHSGLNFWMGNSPGANGYPKIPQGLRPGQEGLLQDSITWAERAAGHPLKRSEVSRYWSAKASAYLHAYPEAWLRLMAVKLRNFWNSFQYDDLSVITLLRERGVLWPGLSWGIVAALGLTGMVVAARAGGPARWIAAAVLLHMLAILPVFVTERYRLAAVPGLLVLGAFALGQGWQTLTARRWLSATSLAASSVAAALFVSLPTREPALWSLDSLNIGVKELTLAEHDLFEDGSAERQAEGQRELAQAERHLARAFSLVQGDPGIVFALGNLWLDKGAPERAAAFYRRTLELNPRFSSALTNLGYLAVEAQDWPAAAKALTGAVKLEPENAKSHYLLARSLEGLQRPAEALAEAETAVRLSPHMQAFLELQERLSSAPKP